MKNALYIVATPIGNLQDISKRAWDVLSQADVVACEDTRVSKKLFSLLGISLKRTFLPLHDHNEELQSDKIIEIIQQGSSVALVSDAGSPLISDPGYKLIKKCKEKNIDITTIPGPCALICALQLSALPTDRFLFAGFVPNKEKARADFFNEIKNTKATLVCYETAPRILKTLEAVKNIFPNALVAVAREISKIYEECKTGSADELIAHFSLKEPKGEMVLMIYYKEDKSDFDLKSALIKEMKESKLKTAVDNVVKSFGVNKNDAYKLALEIKDER